MSGERSLERRRGDADSTILQALGALELKLTELIRAGLTAIQDQHSRAQLDQARLNATFADRERVEQLARRVDRHETELTALHHESTIATQERKELRDSVSSLVRAMTDQQLHLWSGAAGYLISGGFIIGGAILGQVIAHLLK